MKSNIIIKHRDDMPHNACGMTDFSNIYICSGLSKREYSVILKHERSHILLHHNSRKPKDANHRVWNIACDMEIARNIYDDEDDATINRPFSRIKGGITRNSIEGLPDELIFAEPIYEWIVNNKKELSSFAEDFVIDDNAEKCELSKEDIKSIVDRIKEDFKEASQSEAAQLSVLSSIDEIKKRPPSLSAEIDSCLRVRSERVKSYRRQSRVDYENGFLSKGRITKKMPPLVEIFFDRSGSFTPEKTAHAKMALDKILDTYGVSIKSDVWYFGGGKVSSSEIKDGGDTPYHLVYQHLKMTMPKIAVIITDDDPVGDSVSAIHGVKIVCVPIGCASTAISKKIGGIDCHV